MELDVVLEDVNELDDVSDLSIVLARSSNSFIEAVSPDTSSSFPFVELVGDEVSCPSAFWIFGFCGDRSFLSFGLVVDSLATCGQDNHNSNTFFSRLSVHATSCTSFLFCVPDLTGKTYTSLFLPSAPPSSSAIFLLLLASSVRFLWLHTLLRCI